MRAIEFNLEEHIRKGLEEILAIIERQTLPVRDSGRKLEEQLTYMRAAGYSGKLEPDPDTNEYEDLHNAWVMQTGRFFSAQGHPIGSRGEEFDRYFNLKLIAENKMTKLEKKDFRTGFDAAYNKLFKQRYGITFDQYMTTRDLSTLRPKRPT